MGDLTEALAWSIATVLLAAAMGKVVSNPRLDDLIVSAGEGGVGGLLVLHYAAWAVGILVVAISAAYFVHALRQSPGNKCHCFGAKLPSSGVAAQRGRNGALFFLSCAYLGGLIIGASQPSLTPVDRTIGVLVGLGLLIVPWFLEWAVASPPSRDEHLSRRA
jgi:hypothetical protein